MDNPPVLPLRRPGLDVQDEADDGEEGEGGPRLHVPV